MKRFLFALLLVSTFACSGFTVIIPFDGPILYPQKHKGPDLSGATVTAQLSAWFEPEDYEYNSGGTALWPSRIGNAILSMATETQKPELVDGKLEFTRTTFQKLTGAVNITSPGTMVIKYQDTVKSYANIIRATSHVDIRYIILKYNSVDYMYAGLNSAYVDLPLTPTGAAGAEVVVALVNNGTVCHTFVDGTKVSSTGGANDAGNTVPASIDIGVGGNEEQIFPPVNYAFWLEGTVSWIKFYDRALTDAEVISLN